MNPRTTIVVVPPPRSPRSRPPKDSGNGVSAPNPPVEGSRSQGPTGPTGPIGPIGPTGPQGLTVTGETGEPGRGIDSIKIVDGFLIVTYTDGKVVNVGQVQPKGKEVDEGKTGFFNLEVYQDGKLERKELFVDVRMGSTVRVMITDKDSDKE